MTYIGVSKIQNEVTEVTSPVTSTSPLIKKIIDVKGHNDAMRTLPTVLSKLCAQTLTQNVGMKSESFLTYLDTRPDSIR